MAERPSVASLRPKFLYRRIEGLPPLSWGAVCDPKSGHWTVYHGKLIETRSSYFFEGVWDDSGGTPFWDSDTFSGTGAVISATEVRFVAPFHTCDRLHFGSADQVAVVSNSLPFALALLGDEVDPDYDYYINDINTIVSGISRHKRSIPTKRGEIQLAYSTQVIFRNGCFQREPYLKTRAFESFSDYYSAIERAVRCSAANGRASWRRAKYTILPSISSGYDSAAAAVLAREAGASVALTFADAPDRTNDGHSVSDSGADIARVLGLRVRERTTRDYLALQGRPFEQLFWASGHRPGNMALSIFEDLLTASIFITGVHGDKIWDKNSSYWCTSLERGDAGGLDLTEYRLHVPFIHYPVPFLFARSHESINRIAQSSQMRAWSVGGNYDRPIPRRILEEAGVPRGSFGTAKKAIVPAIKHGLASSLRAKALKDYNQFFLSHAPRRSMWRQRALFRIGHLGIKLRKAYEKILQRRIGPRARIAVRLDYYDTPLGLDYSLRPRALEDLRAFAWAVGYVQTIYGTAFAGAATRTRTPKGRRKRPRKPLKNSGAREQKLKSD